MIPCGAKQIAYYWYSDGHELVVFAYKRKFFVRDAKTGLPPHDPELGVRDEEQADSHLDVSYECLGLYYDYEMAHTGWSGDC